MIGDVAKIMLNEAVRLLDQGLAGVDAASLPVALYSVKGDRAWPKSGATPFPDALPELTAAAQAGQNGNPASISLSENTQATFIEVATESGLSGYLLSQPASDAVTAAQFHTLLLAHGRFLSIALHARRTAMDLTAELSDRYEELNLIYDLSSALRMDENGKGDLTALFESVYETLQVDGICLRVPDFDRLEDYPADGEGANDVKAMMPAVRGRIDTTGLSTVVNHLTGDAELAPLAGAISHVIAADIEVDGDHGTLAIYRFDPDQQFFMGDVRLLESVSRQVSIFLTNEKMIAARQQLFDTTIFGLARLAESRDKETGDHLERTSAYCKILSEHLMENDVYPGMIDELFIENILRSSPLHDIGKVGIPDSVLNKPGKLTDEEFDHMKTHTTIGGDTLRDIENSLHWGDRTFLSLGREIAYHHHEKWDGRGYPDGLAGEDIPLSARIMALADVYDALCSRRCYKEAFAAEKVRGIIVEGRGSHFDPRIVDAFIEIEAAFEAVPRTWREEDEA